MKLTNIHSLLLFIFLSTPIFMVAQDEIPLTVHHKTYAKGGSIVVGNTILGKHKSNAFDSQKTSNDVINMVYVDVDNDSKTFSSSSAQVTFPKGTTNILYAGLYWSGLYPAEKSTMRLGSQRAYYKKKGGRQVGVDSIKIKLGDNRYVDIVGDIVYDAKAKGKFKKFSPYVCRADITEYLKTSKFYGGNFTAANIRAIRGKLQGGSAAGWHLYIVYENPKNSSKFFTTYDGFRQVDKKPVEIIFSDFKTKTLGNIESTLVMATLEGDIKIKSDQCGIFSTTENKYITLQTPTREGTNFFNSSITLYSEMFLDRNPPSKNTLGFDLVKMKLADGLIANNAEEAKIGFKSKADVFYLYFIAFETEIEEALMLQKNPNAILEVNPTGNLEIPRDPEARAINENVVPAKKQIDVVEEVDKLTEINETNRELINTNKDSLVDKVERKFDVAQTIDNQDTISDFKRNLVLVKETTVQNAVLKLKEDTAALLEDNQKSALKDNKSQFEEKLNDNNSIEKDTSTTVVTKRKQRFNKNAITKLTIEGVNSGYFLVTNVFSQEKLAQEWMAFLIQKGYSPQQFINPVNGWHYVYILRTNALEEIREQQKELRAIEFLRDIWIAGVNR